MDDVTQKRADLLEPQRKPSLFSQHAFVVLLSVFAIAYASAMTLFLWEGHPTMVVTGIEASAAPVEAEFIAVDLVRETITMALKPDPTSSQNAARGRLLSDIHVEIDAGGAILSHTFKGGEAPISWLVTIPIDEGDLLEYPFDTHSGDFAIKAQRKGGPDGPAKLELDKVVHGFELTARGRPSEDKSQLYVHFKIERSAAVLFLACIAMASLTLVVFSSVNVAWQVARNGRKAEFSMMTWIAALLFVVPTVRNSLPGGPPHGALVDVGLFFWLHILTVGSLLTVVMMWSKQK